LPNSTDVDRENPRHPRRHWLFSFRLASASSRTHVAALQSILLWYQAPKCPASYMDLPVRHVTAKRSGSPISNEGPCLPQNQKLWLRPLYPGLPLWITGPTFRMILGSAPLPS